MKRIYLTAAVMAAMSASFVACTNEMDEGLNTPVSSVVEGQNGKVLFSINTGKGVTYTRAAGEDQALKTLSVFIFDAIGDRISGVVQDYQPIDFVSNKLEVTLPSNVMNKIGLKAYLVANQVIPSGEILTEEGLLALTTVTDPKNVSTEGVPMTSGVMQLNTTSQVITLDAVMKRAMSALFVKVNPVTDDDGAILANAGDFEYKVTNVRIDKGYLFKDEVCAGEFTTEEIWTPNAHTNDEELLNYMYQTDNFEVKITPAISRPDLGSASRTVVVAADKAKLRNKKYVLNVLPHITATGKIDFTVTVKAWDGDTVRVDWAERAPLNVDWFNTTPKRYSVQSNSITLRQYTAAKASYFGTRDWFVLGEEVVLGNLTVNFPEQNSKTLQYNSTKHELSGYALSLEDTPGEFILTTMKNGVQAIDKHPFTLEGKRVRWNGSYNEGITRSDGINLYCSLLQAAKWLPLANIFELGEGWTLTDVRGLRADGSSPVYAANGNPTGGYLHASKGDSYLKLQCGVTERAHADVVVTVTKDGQQVKRELRILLNH